MPNKLTVAPTSWVRIYTAENVRFLRCANDILNSYQNIEDSLDEIKKKWSKKLNQNSRKLVQVIRSANELTGKAIALILPG